MPDGFARTPPRRTLLRTVLGPPGSLLRWFVGSSVWLFACWQVSLFVHPYLRIVIFIFAVSVAIGALRVRGMFIGDEDLLKVEVRRELWRLLREGGHEEPASESEGSGWPQPAVGSAAQAAAETEEFEESDEWQPGTFGDAPAPPTADFEPTADLEPTDDLDPPAAMSGL
jgi:hypothetical protein